jgi:hypothetical protein
MKIILLSSALLVFLFVMTGGALGVINHDTYVIGGQYNLLPGEIVHGNLKLAFAQVNLQEGSRIDGEILSISSAVDIHGAVAGKISSIESDLEIDDSADVRSVDQDKDVIPFVILLPRMARWNLSFAG